MTRVLNMADAEQAARIRELMSGKLPAKAAKPPKVRAAKLMLSEFGRATPDGYLIQRAVMFDSRIWHQRASARWASARCKPVERDGTIAAWLHHFPKLASDESTRRRVRHIEWIRIGPQKIADDNIRTAWKYVRDATCAFVWWGVDVWKHKDKIGMADDWLEERGVTWSYLQRRSEAQPRGYAIQIRLHLDALPQHSSE